MREYPPYKPQWEANACRSWPTTRPASRPTRPPAACPPGFPRIMGTPYPLEFIIEPNRVIILFETSSQMRRIWTDGRPAPGRTRSHL